MPHWLAWLNVDRLGVIVALATAVSAVVYAHRQTVIAQGAQAEAKRSADAAEEQVRIADAAKAEAQRSAEAALKAVAMDARRDHHDYGASRVELENLERRESQGIPNVPSYIATVRNASPREFMYRARVYYTANSYSDLKSGTMRSGETVELHLGSPDVEYERLEMWLDGECSCDQPDGAEGHWQRSFLVPPAPRQPTRRVTVLR
ncbi:hypothetical protein O7598_26630 [Micromonospora sp. WMMC241]|uniref:hypothetical protein n=1 Tax=Micromonospora sp. WMMC241 TaxID=3015159 RepID=UPI0022B7304A|nr:hypothetical protein [Micromonospora sp. WMMC241]MCZ7440005.1 hypothetical protein [Micromonospora sp. WMMC241]